jgi:transketolase
VIEQSNNQQTPQTRFGDGQFMDVPELAHRIRCHTLRMTSRGGSSHIGSIFSIADIVAALYGRVARVDPANPRHPQRDRIILSKGHAGAAIYAALAELDFFPVSRLSNHYQDGSNLSGHVSHKGVPGVELSTGSLGHGLPVATGMAYAAKLRHETHRVFAILSDGECDEGSNWEAILFAAHHELSRLVAIIDYNKLQSLAAVDQTLRLEPFADKWRAFGWSVQEVDGHDHAALEAVLQAAPLAPNKPTCIIAHTMKGKGVSFMENSVLWHYRTARGDEFDAALTELTATAPDGGCCHA